MQKLWKALCVRTTRLSRARQIEGDTSVFRRKGLYVNRKASQSCHIFVINLGKKAGIKLEKVLKEILRLNLKRSVLKSQ